MGIRSGCNFQDAGILQVLMGWQNALHQCQNAIKEGDLIFFRKVSAFIDQGFEGFLSQVIRINPSQVEPYLQIAEVLFGKVFNCGSNCSFVCAAAQIEQFLVARVNRDDVVPVGVKEPLQDEGLLFHGQFCCWDFRQHPVKVLGPIIREVLQLPDQGRSQVDCRLHAFLCGNHLSHVEVILGGVHTHPGSGIEAIFVFVVHRLMLMPGEVDVQRVFLHDRSFRRCWLFSHRGCRFNRHIRRSRRRAGR